MHKYNILVGKAVQRILLHTYCNVVTIMKREEGNSNVTLQHANIITLNQQTANGHSPLPVIFINLNTPTGHVGASTIGCNDVTHSLQLIIGIHRSQKGDTPYYHNIWWRGEWVQAEFDSRQSEKRISVFVASLWPNALYILHGLIFYSFGC